MKTKYLLLTPSLLLLLSTSPLSHTSEKLQDTPISAAPAADITASIRVRPNETSDSSIDPPITLARLTDNAAESTLEDPLDLDPAHTPQAETVIYFSDEQLAEMRQLFLKAEEALKHHDDAAYFLLADKLVDYPLYPYLQYQWLKSNLDRKRQIVYFLEAYASSRYADKLRSQWLDHLAEKKQWATYLKYYDSSSRTRQQCYFHQAQYETGNTRAALDGAKKLWVVGFSQPRECDPLFDKLKDSNQLTRELLWQRFDAAMDNNKTALAKYIKRLMPPSDRQTARLWINLHRDPARFLPIFLKQEKTAQSADMFDHAILRLARHDLSGAIQLWDSHKEDYALTDSEKARLEKNLAMKLAMSRDAGAYERFSQISHHDDSSRAWRVRAALLEQNWNNVLTALNDLSDDEKREEKWQYWYARAYLKTGDTRSAHALLSDLASKRSYYGYLAADRINTIYQLADKPVDVTMEQILALKNTEEFRVAYELMVLDRKMEAKLQWWHAVKQLDKKDIIIAAKLAQRWQWDEIAIFTVAKARYWDDIEMRFPMSYADSVLENSSKQNLNPAIVFGLIRRESAFNERAHSPAGARGLMQIMPATGRQIARDFNERWRGNNSLYQPVMNLRYGSYYYQKLLTQFDGNYAIALAAYNAGPERVKKWLPEDEALPADIWIETIPYHETRDYVATVLAYALIYQQRTQSRDLSMSDMVREIKPYEDGQRL